MARVGISTEFLDGRLSTLASLPEDVTLIVARSTSGPSNQIYNVSSTEAAKQTFGTNSPLVQLMKHAYAGGASAVALYRVGGAPASIENLFGEYTTLRTTAETVNAGATLKVYAGPRANDPENTIVVVYEGSKIVYSNAPGNEIDLGVVRLDGFDAKAFPYTIGELGSPVAFKEVPQAIRAKEVQTAVGDGTIKAVTLLKAPEKVLQVLVTTKADITSEAKFTLVDKVVTLDTAPAKDDVIQVVYTTAVDAEALGITYKAGEDNLGATYNKLYELYDTAFVELEVYNITSIVIEDLFDAPNIASGVTEGDRLSYVIRTEDEDGFKYEWADTKYVYQLLTNPAQTTTDPAKAALDTNGAPIIVKQFNEVDFAHRLGMWAWTQSNIAHYVNGVIGPVGPKANYTLAIKRWVGSAPIKDAEGNVLQNGKGLLGNRFLAGSTAQRGGFYATDSGYPDGVALLDSGNVVVDIGKHLSIPIMPVYLATDFYTPTGATIVSAAASYAGLLSQVNPGDSTTNILMPGVAPLFRLKANQIQALANTGYVVFEEKEQALYVYSGELATREESDYDYISTAIALTATMRRLRSVINPYIGRGISETMMAALYDAIYENLRDSATQGYINGFSFNLFGSGPHNLRVVLNIRPKYELRDVSITIGLLDPENYSL